MAKDDDKNITRFTAEQKITAGLEQMARGPVPRLSGLGELLKFEALNKFAKEAGLRGQQLTGFYKGLADAFEKFEREELPTREAELRQLPISAGQRLEHLRRVKNTERKRLLEISGLAKERLETLQALREQRDKALAVRDLWANPTSVLVRLYSTSESAKSWREAAKSWGANQVRDQIDVARATGDHGLLVVCFERMDAMPSEDRKHIERAKSDVVAEMPVAKMAARAVMACDAVALVHDAADLRRREVEGGAIQAHERIDVGARALLLEPFFADPEDKAA
jgi:hypothetical protein